MVRRLVLVLGAVVALAGVWAQPASAGVSTAFGVNAAHSGLLTNDTLAPPLAKHWSRDLGGNVSYPLVAGGLVYVTVENTVSYGTTIHALSAATGRTVWSRPFGGLYYFSAATYDAGRLFVLNFDGVMIALEARTGRTLWATQLPGQYAFTSPPTASNGVVYVGGAGSGGTLYAVRATDGRVLWTRGVQNGDHSSPAVAGGRVFVSYACPQTYAFTLAGAPAWHYSGPCSGGGGRTPVVHGGRVYVRDFSDLVLSATTGALVDTFSADAAPAFSGTTGLFVADGVMRAQRTTTGVGLWTFAGDRRLVSAPIIANGYAYVASASGRVYAVRLTTGVGKLIGITPAPVLAPDEHNARILTGIAGGGGQLFVPASGTITAYH